jgi:hypothetical protein
LIAAAESGTLNLQLYSPLQPTWLEGLQSFNLYYTPEPSAFALIGLAAGVGLWSRRKVEATKPTTSRR